MKRNLSYIIVGFLAWIIAEYATVWAERGITEWVSYMPFIFIFYIIYPALFSIFIYKYEWNNKQLFIATIIIGFALELVFFGNYKILQLPTAIYYIPALIIIYSFLTFAPKIVVSKLMKF